MGYIRIYTVLGILVAGPALARPVSYPEGWMLMSMNDRLFYSTMLSYSPTAKDAFGVRSDYMRKSGMWMQSATYNRLVQRWNAADSQANIFLMTGAGAATMGDKTTPAASLGMEADWETRRYYVSYENRYNYGNAVKESFNQKARVGVAPYIGGYEDVHSWLMVQVDHQPSARVNSVVTPMVRVFNTAVMGEAGVSLRGDVMVNATFQF